MESPSTEETQEAINFYNFYIDLVENRKGQIVDYLKDTVAFEWFGHVTNGKSDVLAVLNKNLETVKHIFNEQKPFLETPSNDVAVSKQTNVLETPKKLPKRTKLVLEEELGQGDGFHNNSRHSSPAKRPKYSENCGDGDTCINKETVKYVTSDGMLEFSRPSSKKLQRETKWKRSCKLCIAYTFANDMTYSIQSIAYKTNIRCCRNLLKEFCAEEPEY